MKMYEVGGCVRDEILGVPSKDIDYSVVLEDKDFYPNHMGQRSVHDKMDPFSVMVRKLENFGFQIFKEDAEFLTVRAQFPKGGGHWADGRSTAGLTADFVLARKESDYADGRRPDKVEPGTLEDDLSRRDFTMNAIAKDANGSYIDPFNGRRDIERRIIAAVGDPAERLHEDALRAVRAIRFAVTKRFRIEGQLMKVLMFDTDLHDKIANNISDERIAVEVHKMFMHNTMASLDILNNYKGLTDAMFAGKVWLDASMKERGKR